MDHVTRLDPPTEASGPVMLRASIDGYTGEQAVTP
jgi:hypothetical protein